MNSTYTISREGYGTITIELSDAWENVTHPYKRVGDQIWPYGPSYITICGTLVRSFCEGVGIFQVEEDRADVVYTLREEIPLDNDLFTTEISDLRFLTLTGVSHELGWHELKYGDVILIQGFFNYDNVQKYWKYFEEDLHGK